MREQPVIYQQFEQKRYGLGIYAFIATLAAGGAAYFAYTQYTGLQQASRTAAACEESSNGQRKEIAILRDQMAAHMGTASKAKGSLAATQAELEQLRAQRAETAKRLAAFKELTEKFQKMIDTGKLDVLIRNGQMIVKLRASVLFPSGSAVLSNNGKKALTQVAGILRELKDRRFMVAGHTDDRPLDNTSETAKFRNNWELSVGRALTVTQFLIEARMSSKNLVAAGYSEYDPVSTNATVAGRRENRRIEIVLLPDLGELPLLK